MERSKVGQNAVIQMEIMRQWEPRAIQMENIVGVRQQVMSRMVEPNVMSRPLRGCSTTTTGPRLSARSTVRSTARAAS